MFRFLKGTERFVLQELAHHPHLQRRWNPGRLLRTDPPTSRRQHLQLEAAGSFEYLVPTDYLGGLFCTLQLIQLAGPCV